MLRCAVSMFALMVVFGGAACAEELKATIKSVDADNRTIVFTVAEKDKTFTIAKDAEIFTQAKGRGNRPGPKDPVAGGITGLRPGAEVVISTIKAGSREVVTSIKVEMMAKRKKP